MGKVLIFLVLLVSMLLLEVSFGLGLLSGWNLFLQQPKQPSPTILVKPESAAPVILQDLEQLARCSPRTYATVAKYVSVIWVYEERGNWSAFVNEYLPGVVFVSKRALEPRVPPHGQMAILTHEARHLWQYENFANVWSPQLREQDADAFAEKTWQDCLRVAQR